MGTLEFFFCKKLSPRECNLELSTFSKELLTAYLVLKHFHHYILGYHFTLHTNHKALIGTLQKLLDRSNPQEARQLAFFAGYSPHVVHITSVMNVVANTLSRCVEDLDLEEESRWMNALSLLPPIDRESLVKAQSDDYHLQML